MKVGIKGSGGYGTDGRSDRGKGEIKPDQKHGYAGQHGQGPQEGQGHQGSSARLSDQGSQGRQQKGPQGHELGSHSGARREHVNPGTRTKRRGDTT